MVTGAHNESSLFFLTSDAGSGFTRADISEGEYFFDDNDQGVGSPANPKVASTNLPEGQSLLEFTDGFSIAGLETGFHKITFRFKNEDGNWSHNESSLFFLTNTDSQQEATAITKGEYFFDSNDLGAGLNNPVTISAGDGNAEQTMLLFQEGFSVSELPQGFHKITFRFQNESGSWSHNESSLFFVTSSSPQNVASAITEGEYFFDGFDQGVGNNEQVSGISGDQLILSFTDVQSTAGLAPGQHTITYRFRNADGSWSHNETDTFEVSGSSYPIRPGAGLALQMVGQDRLAGANSQFTGDFFTFETWVKWNAGEVGIFSNVDDGGISVRIEEDGSLNLAFFEPTDANNYRPSFPKLVSGQWSHLAITFEQSASNPNVILIKGYLNGVKFDEEQGGQYSDGGSNFSIGGRNSNQDFELDEMRIWKTTRTEDEIRDGLARKYSGDDLLNMWHYFRFDDEGNEVVDLVSGEAMTIADGTLKLVRSGAALGDRSMYTYGGNSINFGNVTDTEFLTLLTNGTAEGIHLYEITGAPDPFTAPEGFGELNPERYFGYFLINPDNAEVEVRYDYNRSSFSDNVSEDDLGLARRDDNSFISFVNADAALNTSSGELVATTLKTQSEWILGDRGSATNLTEGETIDNPILVTGFPFNQSGSLALYADDFNGPDNQPSADVFYRFTVPECSDEMTISVCTALFDSYLHLLDANGNVVSSTSTGCPDDANGALISTKDLISGDTYFVVVEADGNGTGNFSLSVEQTEIPLDLVPDEICVPEGLSSQELIVMDFGLDANFSWTGPGISADSRSVTVTNSGTYEVRYFSGSCSIIDQVTVFFDTTPGTLTGDELIRPEQQVQLEYLKSPIGNVEIQSFDGTDWLPVSGATINPTGSSYLITLPALPDGSSETYRMAHTFGGCATGFSNQLTVSSAAFKGDNLENPVVVDVLPFSTQGTNASTDEGTFTDSFGSALGGQNSPDVFYQFTAPACAEQITVSTCGSDNFNSVLVVLNASGSVIASDDNTCEDDASITFDVAPLQTYYAIVEGFGAEVGEYSLTINSVDFMVDLGEDVSICNGQETTIGMEVPGANYLWSTGETTATITTSTPGTYSLEVTTSNGCTKQDDIDVILRDDITPGTLFYFQPEDGTANLEFPINFLWLPASGAATYNLHIWPQGTIPPTEPFVEGLSTNQVEISDGLELGTIYQWRVEAVNICGTQSTFGPTWSFRTGDRPDLQIPFVSFDPNFLLPGEELSVSWSFFNAGLEDALDVNITASVYLSSNNTIENSEDILLQTLSFEDTLVNAQDALSVDTSFTVPTNILAGDYFVLVTFTSDANELNVANNFQASEFQVEVGALPSPDVILKDLDYIASAETGDQVRVTYVLGNIGTEDINEIFEDRIYLSPNPIFDLNNATILATNENVEQITVSSTGTILNPPIEGFQLFAGDEKEGDLYVMIPEFLSPGDYYLHVQGDIFNDIDEANETNNLTSGQAINISAPLLPDLEAVSISTSETAVAGASQLAVSWTVANISQGAPNINSWVDAVYLSPQADCNDLSTCGILIGKFGHSEDPATPLLQGTTYTENQSVFIPNDLSGDFYLYVLVNETELFPENRTNNQVASLGSVSITPSPDAAGPCGDDFRNACEIEIPRNNYGYGIFPFNNLDLTNATLEPGESETYSPGFANQRSLWYTFTIPTSRFVSINIEEKDNQAHLDGQSDISVSVFEPPSIGGLPVITRPDGTSDLAAFTQLNTFGKTFNECLREGTYYVRISAGADYVDNVPLNAFLEVGNPASFVDTSVSSSVAIAMQYDLPADAYTFPFPIDNKWRSVSFATGCLSIDDESEVMPILGQDPLLPEVEASEYDQSAWFVFETDDHIDAFRLQLNASNNFNGINKVGYRLLEGDARNQPIQDLVQFQEAILTRRKINNQTILTPQDTTCSLLPNTFYSVQLFFHRDHQEEFTLSIHDLGAGPTVGADPKNPSVLGVLPKDATPPVLSDFGTLITPGGKLTVIPNNWACNAYLDDPANACDQVNPPANFDRFDDNTFDLRQWYTFELDEAVNLWINNNGTGSKRLFVYRGDVAAQCGTGSDWPDPIGGGGASNGAFSATCLEAGTYTIEVLGKALEENVLSSQSNLGRPNSLSIYVMELEQSHDFDLADFGRMERINGGAGLVDGTRYVSRNDTLGCAVTILPDTPDPLCTSSAPSRGVYRSLRIDSPGVLVVDNAVRFQHRIYEVDLSQLEQDVNDNKDRFAVLRDISGNQCFSASTGFGVERFCVTPGDYVFVAFGEDEQVGGISSPAFTFYAQPADEPKFTQPGITAGFRSTENLGDITSMIATGQTVSSASALITCESNIYEIAGELPCNSYDKMFFREFEITSPQFIQITGSNSSTSKRPAIRLYTGRASEGLDALAPHDPALSAGGNGCRIGTSTRVPRWTSDLDICDPKALPAGWYTVVFYANGGSYTGEPPAGKFHDSDGLLSNSISIRRISPATELQSTFNRPHLASQQGDIFWERDPETSGAFPNYEKRYDFELATLNECQSDREAVSAYHTLPIENNKSYDWVTYYTFTLRFPSYARFSGYNKGEIFPFDVTQDSLRLEGTNDLDPIAPLSPCGSGQQYCNMQPGVYTLAVYSDGGSNVRPTLIVDRLQDSRFDFAEDAYDMGVIAATSRPQFLNLDNLFQRHPVYPGRSWTNDFFSCFTGADPKDPRYSDPSQQFPEDYCHALISVDPDQYPPAENKLHKTERKTLWYTFVIDGPGMVSVSVYNMTKGKGGIDPYAPDLEDIIENFNPFRAQEAIDALFPARREQYPFAIYSDESLSGDLTFEELLASGDFDPTSDNLENGFVGNNSVVVGPPPRCGDSEQTVSWDIDACLPRKKRRYFVVVDNYNRMAPMSQLELSVTHRPVDATPTENDFIPFAYNVNGTEDPTLETVLSEGTFAGPTSTLTCATTDQFDRGGCTNRTIWYRFETDVAGRVRLNFDIDTLTTVASQGWITLYKQNDDISELLPRYNSLSPNELTSLDRSLPDVPLSTLKVGDTPWVEGCLSPGVYYFTLGCNTTSLSVRPNIQLVPEAGDICSNPAVGTVDVRNEYVSIPLEIDCHSWGGDFGEDGFTNTECFFADESDSGLPLSKKDPLQVKSSWFKFSVGDIGKSNLTFDFESFVSGNFIGINEMKFRVLTGSCGAMSSLGCSPSQTTGFKLDCMPDQTDYYIQVISPIEAVGTLKMRVLAELPTDPNCTPTELNRLVADFDVENACQGSEVCFQNLSSQGGDLVYEWDFGDGSAISNELAPCHVFPTTGTEDSYQVMLTVSNPILGTSESISQTVTSVPAELPVIQIAGLSSENPNSVGPLTPLDFMAIPPADTNNVVYTYSWDFGNDSVYIDPIDPTISLNEVQNPSGIAYGTDDVGQNIVTLTVNGVVVARPWRQTRLKC